MKKKIIKVGGTVTLGISFSHSEKEFYDLKAGEWIEIDIKKTYDKKKSLKKSYNNHLNHPELLKQKFIKKGIPPMQMKK